MHTQVLSVDVVPMKLIPCSSKDYAK